MKDASHGSQNTPPHRVQEIFSQVAPHYDVMNDLMSFGLHRLWKRRLLDTLAPGHPRVGHPKVGHPRVGHPRVGFTLLDLAGGTGDIARGFLRRFPGARALVVDRNRAMVEHGRHTSPPDLIFVQGDALALPLGDASVEACSLGFGLRNITPRKKALEEIFRILKPPGRFVCLEFAPFKNPVYALYAQTVIPPLGELVAGSREAYEYLVDSISRFASPETISEEITQAGFRRVARRLLGVGGGVVLHTAWRL